MRIRPARPDERQALEELMRRASLALDDYREALAANPDAIDLPAWRIADGDVIVAEADGAVLGFAAIVGGELDGLFVDPAHWQRGVGTALVAEAVHIARRRGMTLTVVGGPSARGFYEKCGFTVEGDEPTRFGPAFRMTR
jgi:GNAT superfamily N-acetyltransferase